MTANEKDSNSSPRISPSASHLAKKTRALGINCEEMFQRMLDGLNVKYYSQLAEKLEVTGATLNNARRRGSVPYEHVLKYAEVYLQENGIVPSFDWLFFGKLTESTSVPSMTEGQPDLMFDPRLLESLQATGPIKYFRQRGIPNLMLVDTGDTQIRNGLVVFNVNNELSVREVHHRINGETTIGSDTMQTDSLSRVQSAGRVLWRAGSTTTPPVP